MTTECTIRLSKEEIKEIATSAIGRLNSVPLYASDERVKAVSDVLESVQKKIADRIIQLRTDDPDSLTAICSHLVADWANEYF